MMIKAVLDANVLYSAPLRGFLLHLATHQEIIPFWSDEIQDEWIRNLLRNRPDLKRASLERTRRNMAVHFPEGRVWGYESIIQTLWLPDVKDRHVLAAALHAKAECIVTFNLDDFPSTVLQSYPIEAISPDEFIFRLLQKRPERIFDVVKLHRLSLTRPPKTVEEYLATLEKQGIPKTVGVLSKHRADI